MQDIPEMHDAIKQYFKITGKKIPHKRLRKCLVDREELATQLRYCGLTMKEIGKRLPKLNGQGQVVGYGVGGNVVPHLIARFQKRRKE